MTTKNVLNQRIKEIEQAANQIVGRFFAPSEIAGIDYVSLFTSNQLSYDELLRAVNSCGVFVGEKHGEIYRLKDNLAPAQRTKVVRICKPAQGRLQGCADIIPVSYKSARQKLLRAGYTEKTKTLSGVEYTIIEVINIDYRVAIYLPSMPITEVLGL